MSATTRLILHIGDFKTGTTGLQSWLEAGAPGLKDPDQMTALHGLPHAGLAQGLTPRATPEATRISNTRAEELARTLETTESAALVVSAEHFEFADPARVLEMLRTHLPDAQDRIQVIGWVRPHLPGLMARYGESIKIGSFNGLPRDYAALPATGRRMRYAERFGAWRAAFGDRFSLRFYDRAALAGGDLRQEFALQVLGEDPGPLPAPARPNRTPGVRSLALARALHRHIGALPRGGIRERARWSVGRHLGRILEELGDTLPGADPPLQIPAPLARRLAPDYRADAEALDRAFFAGSDQQDNHPMRAALERDLEAAPEAPPLPRPDVIFTPETRAVIALWGRMLADGLATSGQARALNSVFQEVR